MNDNVVVTGVGVVSSLGRSLSEVWDALLAGRIGIQEITGFDARGFECRVAAQVPALTPQELGIHSRDSRIMDLHSLMLMKCSKDAYAQAGLDTLSLQREEIAFYAGMGMVDYKIEDLLPGVVLSRSPQGILDYQVFFSGAYQSIYPLWPLSMLNNISFCQVATYLDIRGENTVFSPHADSGAQAVAEGIHTLLDGKCQAVLAGGVSEKVSPLSLARGHLHGILATEAHQSTAICQPFGHQRKGTVLGEGCGILCLERQSAARRRNARCHAAITGYGFSFGNDGESVAPTPGALLQSMQRALDQANLSPSEIDVLIAHGDGTTQGDRNEIEAIHHLFSKRIDEVVVFSSKGALGHLLAGAPVVDIVLGTCMLQTGWIPPTNCPDPDRSIRFNVLHQNPVQTNPKKIMINCQSYEGQSGSLIIEAIE